MIIVTGATGQLGRQIVEHLLPRVPAAQVGVSVRDPLKPQARAFADQGVRVRRGSYTDPASLAHAFEGASQVLVVSADRMGEECVDLHRTAIGAAVAAGARRILYTSQMGAAEASHFQACRDHAATEEILRGSGVPYTSLRNGFYAASAVNFLDRALTTGEIVLPADGPVAWTAHADLAEATAAVLADEGRFEGPTPPLTASRALSFDDIAETAAELTGRTFTRALAPDAAFRDQLVDHGVPAVAADQVLGIFAAARAGEFAAADPALAELLGREPAGLRDVLRDALRERTSAG
ncbi:NmrA family NAD(P)-binding protein [Streptomyces olivaceus]|uniref:NmrA family NAD(P)-binding protein n=1 Tax=Streptomyces TaxID=1883 RepID=UPI0004C9A2DC|nr:MULTISPECIES: NmrA family NAD(P)-binding protein [Streptomyces]MBZ6104964.1 NmrA family NAD(P)-binding protein [Streptomyces olivaceus]MBZ6201230.1 NmrA family NAD(P)-binding protein [Streptomyces olivaceus]MBZ6285280.1 NmrA family NAD(P)-binding protein [Streptomyces olivaceus]MCC2269641.1 NAD(P)H-binding protein [Streptomyces sp. CT1-17]